MTKRDRVFSAVSHKDTDIVPFNIEFTSEQYEKTLSIYGMTGTEFDKYLGNHCSKISYNFGGHSEKKGFFTDEFGVTWDRTGIDKDIGVVVENLISGSDDTSYSFPEPNLTEIGIRTEKALTSRGDTVLFGKIGMAFFERAWSLCGFQDILMQIALEPDHVRDVLARILEYNLKIIDKALEYGIDGFYFGDDYGQQSGLLMSPDMWRSNFKEGLATMFGRVKEKGKLVALHSCGDITGILPDLVEIGLDIYQTVQPEIYNLPKLKKDFGSNLTFWGAISTQKELPFSSPEGLKDTIQETVRVLSKNGGYIAGPTHRLPPDIPGENIRVLVDYMVNQSKWEVS